MAKVTFRERLNELRDRIQKVSDRLDCILEESSESDSDAIYEEIESLKRNNIESFSFMLDFERNRLETCQERIPKSLYNLFYQIENLFEGVQRKIKRIYSEFEFYDAGAMMRMMYPNGTDDPDFDSSQHIDDFEQY